MAVAVYRWPRTTRVFVERSGGVGNPHVPDECRADTDRSLRWRGEHWQFRERGAAILAEAVRTAGAIAGGSDAL